MVNAWLEAGKPHVWLPYTQMKTAPDPLPIKSASGSYITLEDGTKLLDGISAWWSMCHGYQNPHIVDSITTQASTLSHSMFAGLANEPAYRLAKRLVDITPEGLNKVFFSDSGSVAVEVAMKMAFQYWHNQGDVRRNKFISFKNAYHGDTMGAMSLADPEDGMHKPYNKFMPKQYVVDIPTDEYSLTEFEETVAAISHTVAAIVIEPLLQGAGGMIFYGADILAELYRIAKKHNILFITDEVATGFGRTGMMFACEEASITPDILCLGKAITGGHVGLAATLATDEVYQAFHSDTMLHAFMHGPTFMGNPIACAAANASLDLFEKNDVLGNINLIETALYEGLSPLLSHERVKDVRIKGAIGVVELTDPTWDEMFALRKYFIEQGVWLRPFGNVIYTTPPFTISDDELKIIISTIISAIHTLT